MVTEVYQYRFGRVLQTQLPGGGGSCWEKTNELPNHRGLKKGIAGIMLGGSTSGLEEMGHKVPFTFSHMVQKKKKWRLHRVPEKSINIQDFGELQFLWYVV